MDRSLTGNRWRDIGRPCAESSAKHFSFHDSPCDTLNPLNSRQKPRMSHICWTHITVPFQEAKHFAATGSMNQDSFAAPCVCCRPISHIRCSTQRLTSCLRSSSKSDMEWITRDDCVKCAIRFAGAERAKRSVCLLNISISVTFV